MDVDATTEIRPLEAKRYRAGFVLVVVFTLIGIAWTNPLRDLYLSYVSPRATIDAWVVYTKAWKWGLALALLAIAAYWEKRPVEWRRPTVPQILLTCFAALAAIFTTGVIVHSLHWETSRTIMILRTFPWWVRSVEVATAAVCEEIVFRGYLLERLQELTGSVTTAAVLSSLTFILAHVTTYGIVHALVALAPLTAALTLVYVRTRSLPNVIFLHFLLDISLILR